MIQLNIIVQKFGGTSLASILAREKAVGKILGKVKDGYKVLVVVSAMGRKGDPYSTDTLIEQVKPKRVSKRELDLLLSCGEIISAVVLSNQLSLKGFQAPVLSGQQAGILTDENFGDAEIIDIDPINIREKLEKHEILVVAGFQGATKKGDTTTLARGGSDISAIALAQALGAEYVEIYTDVEGIMTADPSLVKEAQPIKNISYWDLHFLAKNGAEIVHPKAVEMAENSNLPLIIKNTFSNNQGTLIGSFNESFKQYKEGPNEKNSVNALTYKKGKVLVNINYKNIDINELFKKLSFHNIKIDFITLAWDKITLLLDLGAWEKLREVLGWKKTQFFHYKNSCIISFVINCKGNKAEVFNRVLTSLSGQEIPILYLSDISNTFWCLIKEEDMEKALNVLHSDFNSSNQL